MSLAEPPRSGQRGTGGSSEWPDQPAGPAGLVLAPFRAWRYDPGVVADLGAALAPPNDVLAVTDRFTLQGQSPWNAAWLNRPLSYGDAADRLDVWQTTGALAQDRRPGLYAYEQTLPGGHAVRGLLGALALTEPARGIVLPHEDTRPGPIADRLALMTATGMDLEPILLVYDGGPTVAAALDRASARNPLAEATTPDGIRHRLAVVDPRDESAVAGELLPRRALIADGHHRYASYLRRQKEHWDSGMGAGPWDYGLTFLVDAGQPGLEVRAMHRVLEQLPFERAVHAMAGVARVTPLGADPAPRVELAPPMPGRADDSGVAEWLERLRLTGDATRRATCGGSVLTAAGGRVAFVLAQGVRAFLVELDTTAVTTAMPGSVADGLQSLAVSVVARYVLPTVFGLHPDDGIDLADAGSAVSTAAATGGTAVLLPAVTFHDVLDVALHGGRMPRKSTLFLPKPASGLVLRQTEPSAARHRHPEHFFSDVTSTS